MKILQINKFWFEKGGTETHLFALISLLKNKGHDILAYSQKNNKVNDAARQGELRSKRVSPGGEGDLGQKNQPSVDEKNFISEINLDKFYFKNIFKIGRIFWSLEARKNITKLISDNRPDIVHIHNIYHQISPSILPVIKKAGLPIVMTVHDFKLISPDYTLWAHKNHPTAKSLLARLLMSLEYFFHQTIKVYQKNIDTFIVPSEFVYDKLVQSGIAKNKIVIIPHFIAPMIKPTNTTESNYAISFGRLDKSKGLDVLIKSIVNTNVNLKIVGSGAEEKALKQLTKSLKLENQIEFIPHCDKTTLNELIAKSKFSIFPSLVHETFGLGVIESYSLNKPVIVSNVGAFLENVNESTGIIFEAGNIKMLKESIVRLFNDDNLRHNLSQNIKQKNPEIMSPEKYYQRLESVYLSVIEK